MNHPARGALGYLQLPTTDLAASIAFYDAVLGWRGEQTYASFEAPGLIGQWTTDLTPSEAGPVPWFAVDDLYPTLTRVTENGGTVRGEPVLRPGRAVAGRGRGPVGEPARPGRSCARRPDRRPC